MINALIISLISCFALAPMVGKVAHSFSVVSGNVTTRWSSTPKPLLGGISMFTALLIALSFQNAAFADHPVISCAGLFTLIGICDDILTLSPLKKLSLQMIAAFICAKWFLLIPFSAPLVLVIFWIVLFTNAFNFIDGMDGLAVSFAILIFLWMAILGNPHLFSYSILGICLGFLPYNLKNASLYLGDSGSHFLGSAIAVLALPSQLSGIGIPSWQSTDFLPLLFPFCDIVFVCVTRIIRGVSVLHGGTDHIPHRLARIFGEKKTVLLLIGITVLFTLISLSVHNPSGSNNYSVLEAALIMCTFSLVILEKKTRTMFSKK